MACSDTATSPSAPQQQRSLSAGAPKFDYNSGAQWGIGSSDFTVTGQGGSFSVNGLFTVNFPAGSICNPSVSSYGPTEWDKPCVTLQNNQSVRVHGSVMLTANGLAVDFTPAMRFSPDKQVTIYTDIFSSVITANRDFFSKYPSTLRPLAMYYSPDLGATNIADYMSDYSLVTHVDLRTGRVWRRIKHFSGISVATGQPCDPSPDDLDCIEVDGREQ